jgi:glycosyltransferase involved in cell wall biosynthesis
MRYLVLAQIYLPQKEGGAERVARRTAEFLRNSGHEVHILATRDCKGPDSQPDLDIPVHRVNYDNGFMPGVGPTHLSVGAKVVFHARNAIGGVKESDVKELLEKIKPDAIYMHNSYFFQPQVGKVAGRMGIPIVLHVHDYSWMCANIGMYRNGENCATPCLKCRGLTSAWKRSLHPTDIIAVSEFVRDRYKAHGVFPKANWHVLRNTEEFIPTGSEQSDREGMFRFGFIGSLVRDKGIELLIDAYLKLPPNSAQLVIAGRGEKSYVANLAERTRGLLVTWLGQVPKEQFFKQVDAVVVPSLWHEPQSLVLVESIRRKRPLIVSRRGGNTEVIDQVGAGLVFDPSNSASLFDNMLEIQTRMTGPGDHGFKFEADDVLPTEEAFGQYVEQVLNATVGVGG